MLSKEEMAIIGNPFSGISATVYCYFGTSFYDWAIANGITVKPIEALPDTDIQRVPGDVNNDGSANVYDALLVLQYIAGWEITLNEINADYDGDGIVSIEDALRILECCLGGDMSKALRALQAMIRNMSITKLEIMEQPADQTAEIGAQAQFTVKATGDELAYQWYINRNDGKGWCKLNGATGRTYTTSAVTLDDDNCRYRCVITDVYGNEIASDAAALHVAYELPVTGDTTNPALWLIMCLLSAVGIVIMKKKRIIA